MICEMCKNIENPIEDWDKPIFESENFVSFPSVGALVPGYMLILPKHHELSMAGIDLKYLNELISFTYKVAYNVMDVFGPDVCIFEHGPRACSTIDDSCTACIDHAHFHVVPIPKFDLQYEVFRKLPPDMIIKKTPIHMLYKFVLHNYLYLEYPIGQGIVMINETFKSQLIRSVISEVLNIEEYNWRRDPQFKNVNETIRRFEDEKTARTERNAMLPI